MKMCRFWGLLCVTTLGVGCVGISLSEASTRELSPTADRAHGVLIAQDAFVRCRVVGIQTGQLALRVEPGGEARAGLNNGNVVDVYRQNGLWWYVEVIAGPGRTVGLRGWVNSNYLGRCQD